MIATKVEHPVKTDGKWQVFLVSCEGEIALDPSTPPTSFESAVSFCRGWMSGQFVVETTDCVPVPFRVAVTTSDIDINQVNGELSEVAEVAAGDAQPFDAFDCEPVAADLVDAPTNPIPEKYHTCPWPGWRYADERDIGKPARVTDADSRAPENTVIRILSKIDFFSTEFPFGCLSLDDTSQTVGWVYAYVEISDI